jgi:hypothetical protein
MDPDNIAPENLRVLSNDYQRFEMLNIKTNPNGKGPYVLRQVGYAPKSMTMLGAAYLVNRDGVWLRNKHWASLPANELNCIALDSIADVLSMIDSLAGKPVEAIEALPAGVSPEQAERNYQNTGRKLIRRMREARPVSLPKRDA